MVTRSIIVFGQGLDLLKVVVNDPSDDLARKVLADWLVENDLITEIRATLFRNGDPSREKTYGKIFIWRNTVRFLGEWGTEFVFRIPDKEIERGLFEKALCRCKQRMEIFYKPNPYKAEINDIIEYEWLCDQCWLDLARDT